MNTPRPPSRLRAWSGCLAAVLLASPAVASAQPQRHADATASESAWNARAVVERVERMAPRLRVQAAESALAQIAVRRAKWDRLRGQVRLHAGHRVTSFGWLPTDTMRAQSQDQATAGVLAELRIPIYAGGRLAASLEAAESRLQASRHDAAALRLQLAMAALQSYAEVLAAQDHAAVSAHARGRAQQLVEMTRTKREAGIATEADVARAELNLLRYEEDYVARQGLLETARGTLGALLLLDESARIGASGSLASLATASGAPALRHPALSAAHAALVEARADQKAERAAYLPSIELFAIGQYGNTLLGAPESPAYRQRFGPLSGGAAAGVQGGWTVWDFFVTRDRVARAEQLVAMRRAEHDELAFHLDTQRRTASHREQAARERLHLLERGQSVAERALRLAHARFDTGNCTLTEVLDAELEVMQLATHRVQASLDLALAHLERLHAEGVRL